MYVYILQDCKGKWYAGMTDNLERRFREHKRGTCFTTSKMDLPSLEILHYWNPPSYSLASRFERYLHTNKAKHTILDLILGCRFWNNITLELALSRELTPIEVTIDAERNGGIL